jgi:hypothetical protein
MKLSAFKTNPDKEEKGVWVDAGAGLRLRIARMNNPAFDEFIRKAAKPLASQLRLGTLEVKTAEELTARAMSRHVLLGWENLQNDDGSDIPFSQDKAYELLTTHRDFFRMVSDFANDASLFRDALDEQAAKN